MKSSVLLLLLLLLLLSFVFFLSAFVPWMMDTFLQGLNKASLKEQKSIFISIGRRFSESLVHITAFSLLSLTRRRS